MPALVTVFIEVPRYLKKYLLSLYGPEEPIRFPRNSDYNRFLVESTSVYPVNIGPKRLCSDNRRCLGCDQVCVRENRDMFIEVVIPRSNIKEPKKYFHLSVQDKKRIRKDLEAHFIYDYHLDIKEKLSLGIERRIATLMFMEAHNILEDDFSFAAFYRDFNRMLVKRRLKCS